MSVTMWVTVSRASDILGVSERTIRRYVANGRLEAKIEGNRRLVKVERCNDSSVISSMTMSDKDALIEWLKNELEERNRQIERLQDEIRRNHERSGNIIMKLADELEAQRNLLEGKPKRKRDESFWRRLRRMDVDG